MSTAAALGSLNFDVEVHETRSFLGGRATSFPLQPEKEDSNHIDNCQHVLLRCFVNLLDFYRRCGVDNNIHFDDRLYFVRPGGKTDVLRRGFLPMPLHFCGALIGFGGLNVHDKWSLIRTLIALQRERHRKDLDQITMGQWLRSKGVTLSTLHHFWRPILVSALNEEPDRASAAPAFQVLLNGLMATRDSFEIGVSSVPLRDLYSAALEQRFGPKVRVHLRSTVKQINPFDRQADFYVSTVPFEQVNRLIPDLNLHFECFEHSPITGIHLWFDRPITSLPHAMLLNRTIQWLFRKSENYFQAVVSASRSLLPLPKEKIIEIACNELQEFFPSSRGAQLIRSRVVKEVHATYSPVPGLETKRPTAKTKFANVFLAGDWTNTGWPATMEGAVRSGYVAAEAVAHAAGQDASFLVRQSQRKSIF